jgi:hypothetical protein
LLDGGSDGDHWLRHPYYTTCSKDETWADPLWTEREYLVNTADIIDREFAYLTSAGLGVKQWYLMAQVDPYAGVYTAYANSGSDHTATKNQYYFFSIMGVEKFESIENIDYTSLTMTLAPNPASGQVRVNFEGVKGNITVYNMLGQVVYHAENVENRKDISLSNMTTGVYFVTLRSGNATATQKLIVK